jgi:hypothetical protein
VTCVSSHKICGSSSNSVDKDDDYGGGGGGGDGEIWFLTLLEEEHRLRVFENTALRKVSEPKGGS